MAISTAQGTFFAFCSNNYKNYFCAEEVIASTNSIINPNELIYVLRNAVMEIERVAVFNPESYKQELKKLPLKAGLAIAVRATMRALPGLALRDRSNARAFAYWSQQDQAKHLLATFQAFQILTYFANMDQPHPSSSAARVAAQANANAAATALASQSAFAIPYAIVRAAVAACADTPALNADAAAYAAYAANALAPKAAAVALEHDLQKVTGSAILQPSRMRCERQQASALFAAPLWPFQIPEKLASLWEVLQLDAANLAAGFEVWLAWYRDRLEGKPLDCDAETEWALLSKERRAQSPAEINAYLASLRAGAATAHLNRVRAIFIGHGQAGKTSLIKALHGEEVVPSAQPMTKGITIQNARMARDKIHEDAGVFTRVTDLDENDLTVYFWDFGGQVMAHATHQFFLRAKCLYVIVLDARPERNANEEAEYWLEHVRAFGDDAPVLLVGNKSDLAQVNLDLRTLKDKYPNIIDFYPVSAIEAKRRFREEFNRFSRDFKENLIRLGLAFERFTPAQFQVLKSVQTQAERHDFLKDSAFNGLCKKHGIPATGPSGRDSLLKLFDMLGIVLHFPSLPYLTDYVLNPQWLTYGVYNIMYSQTAKRARGRITEADIVAILRKASAEQADKRKLRYPPERCRLIADAMVAFRLAYRLAHAPECLVIPALLEPEQPRHGFKSDGALAFRFDFKGFLPRHVLPALIVDHHADIARDDGNEIVWQNGVLLAPRRNQDAEALIRADYHERNIDILVQGSDANSYLGIIRDSITRTLITMPGLAYEEKILLRPDMRVSGNLEPFGTAPVWISYEIIRTVQKNRRSDFAGPDGHYYSLEKTLAVMPVRPESRGVDVFISYAHRDRKIVDQLAQDIEVAGASVWYDRDLIGGQQFRDVIDQRIDAAKAVIAVWTQHSVSSKWVRHEANRADGQDKLICVNDADIAVGAIPAPFPANHHIIRLDQREALLAALAHLSVKLHSTKKA